VVKGKGGSEILVSVEQPELVLNSIPADKREKGPWNGSDNRKLAHHGEDYISTSER